MGSLVWMVAGLVLFFVLLIVGLAWMYGAQSAKRRRTIEAGRDASKESVR
jgi:hypothetical protein